MDSALFAARVATVALGVLGMLGAMLAITGIFGMASYVVSRRMRELGIRLALGAGRRQILSASLGRAFRLLAYGSVAGIVLGLMATKVLAFIVYQATPRDPFVLGRRNPHHARAGHASPRSSPRAAPSPSTPYPPPRRVIPRRPGCDCAVLHAAALSQSTVITTGNTPRWARVTPGIMFSDLKLALRQLAKSPGFALTAIITLALGIGANAIVFSMLNSIVLKPLNLPGAENLYIVQRGTYPSQSYLDYRDLRDRNRTFESMIAFQILGPVGVDTGAPPFRRLALHVERQLL